jgi:hypothetical protein
MLIIRQYSSIIPEQVVSYNGFFAGHRSHISCQRFYLGKTVAARETGNRVVPLHLAKNTKHQYMCTTFNNQGVWEGGDETDQKKKNENLYILNISNYFNKLLFRKLVFLLLFQHQRLVVRFLPY